MQHKRPAYIQQINSRVSGDEMFVDLTIYDIPGSLLKEFGEKVVAPATQAESTRQSKTCSEKPSSKNR